MCRTQKVFIAMIFFAIWEIFLYYRTYDKKTRKYILAIGISLMFWMLVRMLKTILIFDEEWKYHMLWYMYYIPLIYIPSFYYLASKQICKKWNQKTAYLIIITSTILVIMMLTNNLHKLAFTIPDEKGDYLHKAGYYITVVWIFSLFILATIDLARERWKSKKDYKVIVPFIPTILAILYTIGYVGKIGIFRKTDMSLINGILVFVGIECMLDLKLIPNNINYGKNFKKSNLKMSIVSSDGEEIYQTNYKMKMPQEIQEDILNLKVNKNYNIGKYTYETQKIKGGYSIIENDYSMLEELKNKKNQKTKELKKQEEFLIKNKEIKEKLYGIEIKSKVLQELEERTEKKKKIIEEKISKLKQNDKTDLEKIKLYIGYLKRVSSLVIDNYNEEIYTEEKLEIILNELLSDISMFGVRGATVISKMNIKAATAYNIYDVTFEIVENLKNVDMVIYIYETNNGINLKFAMSKTYGKLTENISKSKVAKIEEKQTKDGTDITILIQS